MHIWCSSIYLHLLSAIFYNLSVEVLCFCYIYSKVCYFLWCYWEILGKSEAWDKIGHSYGKSLGGSTSWLGQVSGNHQGKLNSDSQFYGVSDKAPTHLLCGEKALQRNNDLCHHFCLRENPSSPCLDETIQFNLYFPSALQAAAPMMGLRGNAYE